MELATYAENMYQWLKRQGYSEAYERAGIYEITINGITAYIGKSTDMLWRLAQHYAALKLSKEHKYQILREAKQKGYTVSFRVLCYAESTNKADIIEEIGKAEAEYIRELRPLLNTQIPHADNWRKYDYNAAAATVTLEEILMR